MADVINPFAGTLDKLINSNAAPQSNANTPAYNPFQGTLDRQLNNQSPPPIPTHEETTRSIPGDSGSIHRTLGVIGQEAAKGAADTANTVGSALLRSANVNMYGTFSKTLQPPELKTNEPASGKSILQSSGLYDPNLEPYGRTEKVIGGAARGAGAAAVIPLGNPIINAGIGAISGGTEEATDSPLAGFAAAFTSASLANMAQRGVSAAKSIGDFLSVNKRLDLPNASLPEATEGRFSTAVYDWLAGSPGGRQIIGDRGAARNEAAKDLVNRESNKLGGGMNPEEGGRGIVGGAQTRVNEIRQQHTDWQSDLDSLRFSDRVDPTDYRMKLTTLIGNVSKESTEAAAPVQSSLLQNLKDGLDKSLARSIDGQLPYNDMKVIRTNIGGLLEDAVAGGDGATVGQLKSLYGALSDVMRGAYRGMARVEFDTLNLAMRKNFDSMEYVLQPLLKEGITPEAVFRATGNQAKLGATKLIQVRNQVPSDSWDTFAGTMLRNMGKDNQGNFSLTTFATKWNNLDESVTKALFSDTPYAELPQLYKDLAFVANRFKGAGVFYNKSESGNVINMAHIFDDFTKGLTALVGGGVSGVLAHGATSAFNPSMMYGHGAEVAGLGLAGTGAAYGAYKMSSAVTSYASQNTLARLLTFSPFVKWVATEVPAKLAPQYLTALDVMAQQNADMRESLMGFKEFAKQKYGVVIPQNGTTIGDHTTPKGRGFLEGGVVGYAGGGVSANNNGSILDRLFGNWKTGNPETVPLANPNKGSIPIAPAANQNSKIPGYAEGGLSTSDEAQFQQDMRNAPLYKQWFDSFKGRYGEEPNLNDSEYDYRKAWQNGVKPQPYAPDDNFPHWSSNTDTGEHLKGENHPTRWMEDYMQHTGRDPNMDGAGVGDATPFAEGGPIANENERQGTNILDFFLGQHKPMGGSGLGGPRVSPTNNIPEPANRNINPAESQVVPFDEKQRSVLGKWNEMVDRLKDPPSYPIPEKIKQGLDYFDQLGFDTKKEAIGAIRESAKKGDWTQHWDAKPNSHYQNMDEVSAARDVQLHQEHIKNINKYISQPPGTFTDEHFAEGGSVLNKFQQAVDYYKSNLNLTDEQARGIVKYMQVNESGLNENAVNPTSGALGIAQWLDRKPALLAAYGPKPSFKQQLEFSVKELLGPEKKTLDAIKKINTEKQAYDIWGSLYERPGNAALAKAGVNYKPGETVSTAKVESKPTSIVEHFLTGSDEGPATMNEEAPDNSPILDSLNAAPWVAPETKYAANKILGERP